MLLPAAPQPGTLQAPHPTPDQLSAAQGDYNSTTPAQSAHSCRHTCCARSEGSLRLTVERAPRWPAAPLSPLRGSSHCRLHHCAERPSHSPPPWWSAGPAWTSTKSSVCVSPCPGGGGGGGGMSTQHPPGLPSSHLLRNELMEELQVSCQCICLLSRSAPSRVKGS